MAASAVFQQISIAPGKKLALGVLAIVAAIARSLPKPPPRPDTCTVLEPYGMGDVVSLLPLLNSLRGNGKNTTLLAKSAWLDIANDIPEVRKVPVDLPWTSYDASRKYRADSLARIQTAIQPLRALVGGSTGIDPRGDIRSIISLHLAGCSHVLTLDHYLGTDARVPPWAATTLPIPQDRRRWEIALDLAAPLGVDTSSSGPPRIRRSQPLTADGPVGILCMAPWPGRLWPAERWREVVNTLTSGGNPVVALCGPGQEHSTKEILGPVPIRVCSSIEAWRQELSNLRLFLTLDSGPMHLADAMQLPLIALFGPGQLPMWAPSSHGSHIVRGQTKTVLAPIHQVAGSEQLGLDMMKQIGVSDVLDALRISGLLDF